MATTTVTATYLDPSNQPCIGRVVFRLVAATYQSGLDAIFPQVPATAVLNGSGAISIELEPTSGASAAFDADTMTYQVWEHINGAERSPYYVDIPTSASVDLGALVTYDTPPFFVRELVTPDLSVFGYQLEEDARGYDLLGMVNVTDYGATGDGSHDDTAAIQAAIDAQDTGIVYFPPGSYKVSSTLTVGAVGTYVSSVRLVGAATYATIIEPTNDFAATSVIKYINARRCRVEDMTIHGRAVVPPRACVQFHRDTPGVGAPAVTGNGCVRVAMGKTLEGDPNDVIVDGIRVTCNGAAQDGNNDFNVFEDCHISGFSGIGISFEGKESVSNNIIGGMLQYGAVAVSVQGGNFTMTGTALQEITVCEFDFLAPYTSHYTQASHIIGVQAETDLGDSAIIVRTTDDDYINVHISGYSRYGSQASLTLIDYRSSGEFTLTDSMLQLGQAGQTASFPNPDAHITWSGVSHGFTNIEWEGVLALVGGHAFTTLTLTPGADATLSRVGGTVGSWTAYTPTLAGTGWAAGNAIVSGRYMQTERTVQFEAAIVFGNTSTFGGSAAPTLTLPVEQRAGRQSQVIVHGTDSGTGQYALYGRTDDTKVTVYVTGAAGLLANVTSAAPFTWTTGDIIEISGTYEAA